MNRTFQPISKQTQDKVKLAKQYIESKYQSMLEREQQYRSNWQQIMKALDHTAVPTATKNNILQQAVAQHCSSIRHQRSKMALREYEMVRTIGRGAFGEVKLARHKTTNQVVAIKRMEKTKLAGKKQVASVFLERQCLAASSSKWLVQLKAAFQDKEHLYIAMDWVAGGDLLRLLIEKDIFTLKETRFYIAELVLAIEDMHKINYIHRDIKPDNVLIDSDGHLKLTDFGLSKQLEMSPTVQKNKKVNSKTSTPHDNSKPCLSKLKGRKRQFSKVGTPDYIAPQVLTDQVYDHRVDIWSVGVIMFECLFGYPPFSDQDTKEVCNRVMHWQDYLSFPDVSQVSLEAKILILAMLSPKQHRISIAQIKAHPFFNGFDWNKVRSMQPPFVPTLNSDIDTRYFDSFEEKYWDEYHGQVQKENQQSHKRRSSSLNYHYNFAGFDWLPTPKQDSLARTLKQVEQLRKKHPSPVNKHYKSYKSIKTQSSVQNLSKTINDFPKTRGSVRHSLRPRGTIRDSKPDKLDKTAPLRKMGMKNRCLKTQAY